MAFPIGRTLRLGRAGTFLEELDEQNQEVEFRELMTNSIWYVLPCNRCGLDVQISGCRGFAACITDFNQLVIGTSVEVRVLEIKAESSA